MSKRTFYILVIRELFYIHEDTNAYELYGKYLLFFNYQRNVSSKLYNVNFFSKCNKIQ